MIIGTIRRFFSSASETKHADCRRSGLRQRSHRRIERRLSIRLNLQEGHAARDGLARAAGMVDQESREGVSEQSLFQDELARGLYKVGVDNLLITWRGWRVRLLCKGPVRVRNMLVWWIPFQFAYLACRAHAVSIAWKRHCR